MKQYLAYIRVSTAKQGERGSSLQEQRSAIAAFASRSGFQIVEWFEERETATKSGRAVFARMLALLEDGGVQGVIIHKIDRSARNLRDWAKLGELIDRGVDVQFAHDSVDLRSRGGRLSADIQAVVAADYVRNLREEVIKGLRGRLNQGIYPFAAPIGYLDRGKGRLKEQDPLRAPFVRRAFERYATGSVGLKALRKELARDGLTAPRTGRPLGLNGLSKMLNNPFYTGLIHVRSTNETYLGRHEPIVDKALFERVQAILDGRLVVRASKHDFTYRRLVRCEGCGRNLIGEIHKSRFIYYRCQSASCKGTVVREELLDHIVWTNLSLLSWGTKERLAAETIAGELDTDASDELRRIQASLTLRIGKCEERLSRLTDAYVDAIIDKDLFERRKRHLLAEQRNLQEELAHLSEDDLSSNMALANLELGNTAALSYKIAIPAEKRTILRTITSNFSVQGKKPTFELLSPFAEVANWRKLQQSAHPREATRTEIRELLVGLMALDKKSLNSATQRETPDQHSREAA